MKKKTIALGVLLCLLLCGCEKKNTDVPNDPEEESTAKQEDVTNQNDQDGFAESDADVRLLYYEQLVDELRQELLSVKTELYVSRVEYESRIAELEAGNLPDREEENTTSPAPDGENDAPTDAASDFQYVLKNGTVTITSYVGNAKKVDVPSQINGYPVIAIGDRAFMDNARLTSVTLPQGIVSIGWFAFSGCVSLESVTIPASVSTIQYGAFQNCPMTMCVTCISGSYAEQYANSYGMKVSK